MNSEKRIVIIIPAFNEEGNIGKVVRSVSNTMSEAEILVINDGSNDLTGEEAASSGARVIDLPFNMGIGAAMQTGFIYAKEKGFDVAVQVDGDGQHNPEDISRLLKPIIEGNADVSIGSRYIEKKGDMSTFQRRMGIRIFKAIVSKIMGQKITDPTSGFRAMNSKIINLFSEVYPEDYPEPESLVILHLNGFTVEEVPVSMVKRGGGVSSIGGFGPVYYMIKVTLAIFIDLCKKWS